jgi:hypothetical protein
MTTKSDFDPNLQALQFRVLPADGVGLLRSTRRIAVVSWQREQVSADRQRRNDSFRLAGNVLLLGGAAALIGVGHRIG